MAANVYLNRLSITPSSGWVKLSASRLVCDAQVQPLVSTLTLRCNGGTGIALNVGTVYYFESVDLSLFEISTGSGSAVCIVIGQAPGR